ncbi:MAG: hypothetical protein LBU28_08810 [Spirochaetaceae bacterium]|jgi:hypothetical protein|nr:hypothetical protein [Spirochaetaceae bacterium]
MTISSRNGFFKAGIILATVSLSLITVAAFIILPVYPKLSSAAVQRSGGVIQALVCPFLDPAPYVPFAAMTAAVVYALVTMILIYYFFEKTQAPEILFFAFFVLSLAFEGVRTMIPLKQVYALPGVFLVMASRVLLFGRYFGIFSLFTASVYASGLEIQKQGYVVFILTAATLMIALGVPIDALSWDSSLAMLSGYMEMFRMVEASIIGITIMSFFVSAYSRDSREYIFVGIGSFLVFLGRNMLISADTWITPVPAVVILTLGTWFICTQLHRVYLWL